MTRNTTTRQPLHRRLTAGGLGLVCGAAALTVSLGVPAEAAKLLTGKNIKNNSLTGKDIRNGSLTGKDVKDGSLTGADVKESSLQGFLRTGQVAAFGDAESVFIDNFTSPAFTPIVSTSFNTPSAGLLYVTGSVSAEDDISVGGIGGMRYGLALDGAQLSNGEHALDYDAGGAGNKDSGATTAVVPVSAGAHTVALTALSTGGGSFVRGREVSVLFVPSGSGFTPPARAVGPRSVPQ